MHRPPKHVSRRQVLKAGVLGAGFSLSRYFDVLGSEDAAKDSGRSAILVFLKGGPSHQDTFDLKPNAPSDYRGQFQPVSTTVPGMSICEHLPRLAQRAKA